VIPIRKYVKATLLIVILLLCSAWGSGSLLLSGGGGGASATNYCSDGGGSDPTDIVCDDAEGSTTVVGTDYDTAQLSWDGGSTIDTGAYLKEIAHSGILSCSNKGDYAIEYYVIDAADNDSEAAKIEENITATGTLYAQLYFNIVSEEIDDGDIVQIIAFQNGGVRRLSVRLTQISSNLVLRMRHYTSAAVYTNTDGSTPLSTGTWYRLGVEWTKNSGTAKVYLNGSAECSSVDTHNSDIDSVELGSNDADTDIANDATKIQVDII